MLPYKQVLQLQLNRVVLCRVLERLGFQPLECCTGAEAVQAFTRYGSHIACILMVRYQIILIKAAILALALKFPKITFRFNGKQSKKSLLDFHEQIKGLLHTLASCFLLSKPMLQDINMPVMDGLEATFRIREEERRLDRSSIWRSCGSTERGQVDACTSRNNIAAVPIWAISACCEDEQWHSPVLAYLGDDERRGTESDKISAKAACNGSKRSHSPNVA